MRSVIELNSVTKMCGKRLGISGISLEVEKGAVFGFLGSNGVGKYDHQYVIAPAKTNPRHFVVKRFT